jgi:putative phosphoribosyl transferase
MDPSLHTRAQSEVRIPVGAGYLEGTLIVPNGALGVIAFAHGSGSSRHSPRNQSVAKVLRAHQLGTLLFDLLTPEEGELDETSAQLRFDIELLAERLVRATDWLTSHLPEDTRLGYFGASTGAAAALVAAAERPSAIGAVVSRGGRPDLAGETLANVAAPTLLIVGGADHEVIELNRRAFTRLQAEKHLEIIPGAGHLFEEPGALQEVAQRASDWFLRWLGDAPAVH